jgi:hypothetical protein
MTSWQLDDLLAVCRTTDGREHRRSGAPTTAPQPGQTLTLQALGSVVPTATGSAAIVGGHSVWEGARRRHLRHLDDAVHTAYAAASEIDARHGRTGTTSRIPARLDATVSRLRPAVHERHPYPILIRASLAGVVRFEIWSVPNGRTAARQAGRRSRMWSGLRHHGQTATKRGQSRRTEWPVDGKDVVVTGPWGRERNVIHHDLRVALPRMVRIFRRGSAEAALPGGRSCRRYDGAAPHGLNCRNRGRPDRFPGVRSRNPSGGASSCPTSECWRVRLPVKPAADVVKASRSPAGMRDSAAWLPATPRGFTTG